MDIAFGFIVGFAAINSSSVMLNFCASCPIVSPDLIVYVKGVGEGIGVVTETTNPSGCDAVAVEVIVKYGLRSFGADVALDAFELQAVANKVHRIKIFRMR